MAGLLSVIARDRLSDSEFVECTFNLFCIIAPGDAFVLGIADTIVPEAKLERTEQVSEMGDKYGECTVSVPPVSIHIVARDFL